jgi:hypothetical protein
MALAVNTKLANLKTVMAFIARLPVCKIFRSGCKRYPGAGRPLPRNSFKTGVRDAVGQGMCKSTANERAEALAGPWMKGVSDSETSAQTVRISCS